MSTETPPSNSSGPAIGATTCDYVVLSVNSEARTAEVKFINPYYSGTYIEEEKVPVPLGPGVSEDNAEPKYTTKMVDKDPNPHITKSVNIPFNEDGADLEAFKEICTQQSRGARNRMEAAYARHLASVPAPADLSSLVGMTNKQPSAS